MLTLPNACPHCKGGYTKTIHPDHMTEVYEVCRHPCHLKTMRRDCGRCLDGFVVQLVGYGIDGDPLADQTNELCSCPKGFAKHAELMSFARKGA